MRIAQIVLPEATGYERKCQRVDRAALSESHEVLVVSPEEAAERGAHVAHVYAGGELPARVFARFPIPYVSSAAMQPSRWSLRRAPEPRHVVSPLAGRGELLPEAVESAYFEVRHEPRGNGPRVVGSFFRRPLVNAVEQTLARIRRFREDVEWMLYERAPTPEELASIDVWVDPAEDELDFDGFVAEALVAGLPVVATRTKINAQRLEHGRTGWLVPPRDPNEMTHAILAALFKPEVAFSKTTASRQTAPKFRPRQRMRVLAAMYDNLLS